jgi:hypothetical protein
LTSNLLAWWLAPRGEPCGDSNTMHIAISCRLLNSVSIWVNKIQRWSNMLAFKSNAIPQAFWVL